MRLTVFGLGYLGLTHAACMAEAGHEVLGVDIAPARVAQLQAARVPFYEPGLAELVARGVESGRLRFSCDYRQAAEFAQLHFIAVGTPERADSPAADTSAVEAVVDQLAPLLRGTHVLVGKSTVPVGTAARLQERAANISRATVDILWNPEFLREGHAVADTLRPDRIVVGTGAESTPNGAGTPNGVSSAPALQKLREVYRAPLERGTPFLVMPWASAELVKSAANAFLATKISFINAIAEVCEAVGGDVAVERGEFADHAVARHEGGAAGFVRDDLACGITVWRGSVGLKVPGAARADAVEVLFELPLNGLGCRPVLTGVVACVLLFLAWAIWGSHMLRVWQRRGTRCSALILRPRAWRSCRLRVCRFMSRG